MGGPEGRGSHPKRRLGRRLDRESERSIVPLKPGNSGGGKGPYFWDAFEGTKDEEIGESLMTPEKIRQFQRKLYVKAKEDSCNCVIRCPREALGDSPMNVSSENSESNDSARCTLARHR